MAPRSPPWNSTYSHLASASYLADLRTNRPARPTGSRPLPARPLPQVDENVPPRAGSALSLRSTDDHATKEELPSSERTLNHRASLPNSNSLGSISSQKGRPLVSSPFNSARSSHRKVSPPSVTVPELRYKESRERLQEKEEAHKIREALERIDQSDEDEQRIHNAAKMEAADLVWKHRNPSLAEVEKTAAYPNPDLDKPKYGELESSKKPASSTTTAPPPKSRASSGESTASSDSKRPRLPWLRRRPKQETPPVSATTSKARPETTSIIQRGVRKISGKRQASSGSSKGVFTNPEDEIYEEAEEMPVVAETRPTQELPLRSRESNSLPRGSRPLPEKSYTDPLPKKLSKDRLKLWKNDSVQARNVELAQALCLPKTPVKELPEEPEEAEDTEDSPRYKDGIEIRGDDIRAATSMKKSDRSPNLPTPTAVSDRLGRPIVSFDRNWTPATESPKTSLDIERPNVRKEDGSRAYPVKPTPPVPQITIMEHPQSPALQKERQSNVPIIVVPSINISESAPEPLQSSRQLPQIDIREEQPRAVSVPTINVETGDSPLIPVINVQADERPRPRPLPAINVPTGPTRPLPSHTQSSPSKIPAVRPSRNEMSSRVPWLSRTPTSATSSTVTCTACTLPISGRIVTASGSVSTTQKARFHPECFTCHHCSTGLECVAFYPEPEGARLERCQSLMTHLDPEDREIAAWVKSNEDLHFFCHLDYHELFSPRCHNCKTPIEGAIILALGRHYHADHFFCAECGDPFSSESPFVEHNNYPYCVSCHTKRTSARCRSCKKPILNEVTIEALGGKWHDACFVCCECGGDFGDDGRFFVREIEIELTEKEKRRGNGPKIEEVAACQSCEERRVKNVNIFV